MPLGSLWLPIVLSAIAVWIASSIAWMVLPHHRADFKRLPDEDAVAEALRKAGVTPGVYRFPHCASMQDAKAESFLARLEQGPVGTLTITANGPPRMVAALGQYFAWTLAVAFVTGYVARHSLNFGAPGLEVMRMTATVSFLAYSFGGICDSIWMGRPWAVTLRFVADGVAYAAITGAIFVWMWPAVGWGPGR